MSELMVRVGQNDHKAVADLLASPVWGRGDRAPAISRVVVDAHIAATRPEFAESAAATGSPLLIDPLTPLLEVPTAPKHAWDCPHFS